MQQDQLLPSARHTSIYRQIPFSKLHRLTQSFDVNAQLPAACSDLKADRHIVSSHHCPPLRVRCSAAAVTAEPCTVALFLHQVPPHCAGFHDTQWYARRHARATPATQLPESLMFVCSARSEGPTTVMTITMAMALGSSRFQLCGTVHMRYT